MQTRFWVAGFPLAFTTSTEGKKREKIFPWLKSLWLNALELQMTYGPRSKKETCELYRQLSEEFGIKLSVHAAYYIVLTSSEEAKISQSIDTLKRTFQLSEILWAKEIILHPGPLYGKDESEIKKRFIENTHRCMKEIWNTDIWLFIETAWKVGQLGSIQDILEISSIIPGVHPCIDFWHVHARTLGTLSKIENIHNLEDEIKNFLKNSPEKNIHFHYTPIHYWPRWEIQHRAIDDYYPEEEQINIFWTWDTAEKYFHPRPEPIWDLLKNIPREFTVISETHNSQEKGALALKEIYLK